LALAMCAPYTLLPSFTSNCLPLCGKDRGEPSRKTDCLSKHRIYLGGVSSAVSTAPPQAADQGKGTPDS